MSRIAYFVHDLSDAAVHRRVRMLLAGGAEVIPIGFRRSARPVDEVKGVASVDLGRTRDGRLAYRALSVAGSLVKVDRLAERLHGVDVVLARNLEMLVIAQRARERHARGARLIYECLDIHRLMLSPGLSGKLLRRLELGLARDVVLLLTSSPAFIDNYFSKRDYPVPIRLIENKVLLLDGEDLSVPATQRPSGPPWRIGWFGMIRCRRSLEILGALARRSQGAIEVVVRGRPSAAVFADFEAMVRSMPHLHFNGAYRSEELPSLYADVHFCWAIDYYEEGQNSAWLLPNRVYEGTLYGSVPLALSGVETSRWLEGQGIGAVLEEPLEQSLAAFFEQLSQKAYAELFERTARVPRQDLAIDRADCRKFVEALCGR